MNNFSGLSADTIVQHMEALKQRKAIKQNKAELSLATAIVLMEIASSDQQVDKFERSVIQHGLRALFDISDETAVGVITRAKAHLGNMGSSSSYASLLKDILDPGTKRQMASIMDNLIRCNGVVDGMEIYLRRRFRDLLGLPDEALSPLSSEE